MILSTFKWSPKANKKSQILIASSNGGVHAQKVIIDGNAYISGNNFFSLKKVDNSKSTIANPSARSLENQKIEINNTFDPQWTPSNDGWT